MWETVGPILQSSLAALKPNSLADYLIYGSFISCFIVLFLLPDGNDLAQYLIFGTIGLCIIDLLVAQRLLLTRGASTIALFSFFVHVGIFALPAISVGATRKGKKKPGPAIMMTVIAAIFGALYALLTFGYLMSDGALSGFF
jgi:hypothetical protein